MIITRRPLSRLVAWCWHIEVRTYTNKHSIQMRPTIMPSTVPPSNKQTKAVITNKLTDLSVEAAATSPPDYIDNDLDVILFSNQHSHTLRVQFWRRNEEVVARVYIFSCSLIKLEVESAEHGCESYIQFRVRQTASNGF